MKGQDGLSQSRKVAKGETQMTGKVRGTQTCESAGMEAVACAVFGVVWPSLRLPVAALYEA